ncbi:MULTISPECIES: long-chain fatty acid--CoA ligase [unclassified Oceanispirochaeta]|uniref:AMP-dependent synthetase/ligase n=1 Tax=unclassified Oceanispirochaeta TaxID=2635722 RepID=UPI000E09CC4F|nr:MULTISPECIES: AMP-binding protein [unclassified Oceanispirochaeta]MBF9014156.1 AMP-binding protein [Oceanispirochaeta sp. M2]NPD70646.1 AMP-binding protein [Oceanispirochaeta sp. M1]RDG34408.1 long-chain fatty acid--CoA ligase [Oceanispirochaeta sp. M1]
MTIPSLFKEVVEKHPDVICQYSRGDHGTFTPSTFKEVFSKISAIAWSLDNLGIKKGDHIGLISDNRSEWLITDLAIVSLGAADVPRGCDTMAQEMSYILGFSECRISVLENAKQLEKIVSMKKDLPDLKTIILLDKPETLPKSPWKVLYYEDLLKKGMDKTSDDFIASKIAEGEGEDLCTLIFTSGTTGEPKGVMLSHNNFLHQVQNIDKVANLEVGDIWLSVLPVWHSFERVIQYIAVCAGTTIAYSKPVGKIMLMDMQKLNPQWMASVPRIWSAIESGVSRNIKAKGGVSWALYRFFLSVAVIHQGMQNRMQGRVADFKKVFTLPYYIIYPIPWLLLYPLRALGNKLVFSKIQAKVGNGFKCGISGGGALPPRIYQFFKAIGIQLLEGYGLTETAPVVAFSPQQHPVMGVVGPAWPGTEVKVVNEKGNKAAPGEKGVVYLKGPQVMQGYYKKEKATSEIINKEGWLNSGDLGIMTVKDELKLIGREKDTIVLLGGENIEPVPMEQKLAESPYIEQAVIVGQDQKYLAALIVPDFDALEAYAKENNLAYENRIHLRDVHAVLELLTSEINGLISAKNGFKSFERIYKFAVLRKTFEVGQELSGKQDLKRHAIVDIYKKEIKGLF